VRMMKFITDVTECLGQEFWFIAHNFKF
jgi:hypothetical protein